MQTAVVFSLLLFLFILSVSFMFPCKHCQDGFSALSIGGLTRHQKKCQAFLKHEAAAIERRKATVISMKARRTKLKERKVCLGSTAPEVTFFCDKYYS
jgi:hypothetical protein